MALVIKFMIATTLIIIIDLQRGDSLRFNQRHFPELHLKNRSGGSLPIEFHRELILSRPCSFQLFPLSNQTIKGQ